MTKEMERVKALCTRDEFALYRESLGTRLEQLSPRDLRSRVRRARNMRDRYLGDGRRQRSSERGKLPQDQSVERPEFSGTWRKADIFQEVLARFERRAEALEEKETRRREDVNRPASEIGARPNGRDGKSMPKGRIASPLGAGRKGTLGLH